MTLEALADAAVGKCVRIAHFELEGDAATWIGAVGLHAGEDVIVLRRAAFGGPLHVRTSAGGEFAVAREVACGIKVRPTPALAAERP